MRLGFIAIVVCNSVLAATSSGSFLRSPLDNALHDSLRRERSLFPEMDDGLHTSNSLGEGLEHEHEHGRQLAPVCLFDPGTISLTLPSKTVFFDVDVQMTLTSGSEEVCGEDVEKKIGEKTSLLIARYDSSEDFQVDGYAFTAALCAEPPAKQKRRHLARGRNWSWKFQGGGACKLCSPDNVDSPYSPPVQLRTDEPSASPTDPPSPAPSVSTVESAIQSMELKLALLIDREIENNSDDIPCMQGVEADVTVNLTLTDDLIVTKLELCRPTTTSPTVAPTTPPPPTIYLSGPTASFNVLLQPDDFPSETSIGYRNVCTGNYIAILEADSDHDSIGDKDDGDLPPNSNDGDFFPPILLSAGIYQFFIFDRAGDGISPGGEWSIGAGNITLYKNNLFTGVFDMSGTIVVGGDTSTCPDVKLTGPSATVNVVLVPDYGQEGIYLGYQNLCTKAETTIWDGSIATEGVTDYVFPLVLSAGEYEFLITGNGLHDGSFQGSWLVMAGNVTLYDNHIFTGHEDIWGSHIIVGGGCGFSRPSSAPISRKAPTMKPTEQPTAIPTIAPTFSPTSSPSRRPSSNPSHSPTAIPSSGPSMDTICEDLTAVDIFFNSTIGFKNCQWLSGRKADMATFCVPTHRAWFVCEETCGACDDGCSDSPTALFLNARGTKKIGCAYLSDNSREQSRLCNTGSAAWKQCPETCNACPQPSTSPSNSPTTAKSSVAPVPTLVPLPSSSPSASQGPTVSTLPTVDATCDDLQDVTFAVSSLNNTLKTCDWLADKNRASYRTEMCVATHVAFYMCEETCGKCTDNCFDELGDFPNLFVASKMMTCADLAKLGDRQRAQYCDQGKSPKAEQLCKETCNTCD